MTNDSFLGLLIASSIAMFFGYILAFGGYRFFLVLLPIFGFFWGFGLGAQSMQAIFGEGFLATASSWIVGFLFAGIFALLSYLFYMAAVGIVAFAMGYGIGVGLMGLFGLDFGFISWAVGLILGGLLIVGTFLLNIPKYIIIAATALLGAGVVVWTFLYLFSGAPTVQLLQNPVRVAMNSSFLWLLFYSTIAALGMVAQYYSTKDWEVAMNNRLFAMSDDVAHPAEVQAPPAGQAMAS